MEKDRDVLLNFYDFPAEALAAHKNEQSHRINVRHREIENSKSQELLFIQDGIVYGF